MLQKTTTSHHIPKDTLADILESPIAEPTTILIPGTWSGPKNLETTAVGLALKGHPSITIEPFNDRANTPDMLMNYPDAEHTGYRRSTRW